MMPEKERSSRTTEVKRAAWAVAVSARGAKSATAMRGSCVLPRPVPVRNQSWAKAVGEKNRLKRSTKETNRTVFFADNGASRTVRAHINTLNQLDAFWRRKIWKDIRDQAGDEMKEVKKREEKRKD
jgi:hypothetical protein